METNVLLNQEQKDFLLEQVWLASKEFFEDVLLQNTDKIVSKLEDDNFMASDIELMFLLKYGNREMHKVYCEYYTPSGKLELYLVKYVDSDIIDFDEFECVDKEVLVCAFERGDKNIINHLLQRPIYIDDFSEIQRILSQRNNAQELAIFYNYQSEDTPCDFWEEPQYVSAIIENIDSLNELSEAVVYKLVMHKNLHQQIIQKEFVVKIDMIIELDKVNAEIDILRAFVNKFDSCTNNDLQKLYAHNPKLIDIIVEANKVSIPVVLANENPDIVCRVISLIIDEEKFQKFEKQIYSSKFADKLAIILIDKNWWHNGYVSSLMHYQLFEALHYWISQQTTIPSCHRDDIEYYVMTKADYRCVYAYIERFGLYNHYNEAFISRFDDRQKREELLCLKYDHGGFHSKAGKNLWKAYCKHNIKEKRLSFWQKFQILFS